MEINQEILAFLEEHRDEAYQEFQAKLLPTLAKEEIIGVRVPELRKFVKYLQKKRRAEMKSFLSKLPHRYFEENHIHVLYLSTLDYFEEVFEESKKFLPYLNNWANCDAFVPKVFRKESKKVDAFLQSCLASSQVYTKRFAIVQLLNYCLEENFDESILESLLALSLSNRKKTLNSKDEEYYVQMALAWYFATALAKQWETIIPYFRTHHLGLWTHNKAIQKAVESFRISEEKKVYLKSLRRK